mmetsp:Transcript_12338/g.25122  ORF Transcript_12338/g.25122 Transcript_12338/m.25122 type:complete len:204 (+) Transcript_12338:1127-1738(+)
MQHNHILPLVLSHVHTASDPRFHYRRLIRLRIRDELRQVVSMPLKRREGKPFRRVRGPFFNHGIGIQFVFDQSDEAFPYLEKRERRREMRIKIIRNHLVDKPVSGDPEFLTCILEPLFDDLVRVPLVGGQVVLKLTRFSVRQCPRLTGTLRCWRFHLWAILCSRTPTVSSSSSSVGITISGATHYYILLLVSVVFNCSLHIVV